MFKRLMAMLFLSLTIFLAMVGSSLNVDNTETAIPAVYIFGDSTFDVGTNNFLSDSRSRADKPFYGIDFPNSKPTGRFSNGYNIADFIVKLLGRGYKESPPPFLYLVHNDTLHFNSEILKGVNFASGGSGILKETGKKRFTRVISMEEQIQQFTTVHSNISQFLNGTEEARINKSLFLLSAGSNDIFDFFMYYFDRNNITRGLQEFFTTLMSNYEAHIKNLLNLGARKFGILGVPPLGCVPIIRANASGDHCVDEINVVASFFHSTLGALLKNLSSEIVDLKYSLGDIYAVTFNVIHNRSSSSLDNVTSACCGNATLTGGIPCSSKAKVCENRNQFLFWDEFHPTEYASKQAAHILYTSGSEYVAPINFSLLVLP